MQYLDFEKPILEIVKEIELLRSQQLEGSADKSADYDAEIDRLTLQKLAVTRRLYRNLTAWQKTQVARHPERAHALDYIDGLIDDFVPLAGDRLYGEDKALIGGIGKFNGQSVVVLGTEKGSDTKSRMKHNFGMPKPEGYRKAKRLMAMADKFGLPIISFVDTSGAFPGIEAEARGQSEAIASCIEQLMNVKTPVVSLVIGEGGSGGAIAIAVADEVLMNEHAIYSVISPEGCASILWRDAAAAPQAAEALNLTSDHLKKLAVIDKVVKEPVGGVHRDKDLAFKRARKAIAESLEKHMRQPDLHKNRRKKFLAMTRLEK